MPHNVAMPLQHTLDPSIERILIITELIGKGANGVTLRDQDATNSREGDWCKINTLGHYQLHEMVRHHLT